MKLIEVSAPLPLKTSLLTLLALVAFAANSVLNRLALGENAIDAGSFTSIRLLSGAFVLLLLLQVARKENRGSARGSWRAALMLFLYAAPFSYAYLTLNTGTGALILFGAVQITILLITLFSGNRLHLAEWLGLVVAFAGFVYLVLPGVSRPSPVGFALMALAGVAWGAYTLIGRTSQDPLSDTTYNFARSIPLVIVLVVLTLPRAEITSKGVLLASLSGGIASGVGYTIWYAALRGLSDTLAAVVQLAVPVIAALGGVIFSAETITVNFVIATALILGGILVILLDRTRRPKSGGM